MQALGSLLGRLTSAHPYVLAGGALALAGGGLLVQQGFFSKGAQARRLGRAAEEARQDGEWKRAQELYERAIAKSETSWGLFSADPEEVREDLGRFESGLRSRAEKLVTDLNEMQDDRSIARALRDLDRYAEQLEANPVFDGTIREGLLAGRAAYRESVLDRGRELLENVRKADDSSLLHHNMMLFRYFSRRVDNEEIFGGELHEDLGTMVREAAAEEVERWARRAEQAPGELEARNLAWVGREWALLSADPAAGERVLDDAILGMRSRHIKVLIDEGKDAFAETPDEAITILQKVRNRAASELGTDDLRYTEVDETVKEVSADRARQVEAEIMALEDPDRIRTLSERVAELEDEDHGADADIVDDGNVTTRLREVSGSRSAEALKAADEAESFEEARQDVRRALKFAGPGYAADPDRTRESLRRRGSLLRAEASRLLEEAGSMTPTSRQEYDQRSARVDRAARLVRSIPVAQATTRDRDLAQAVPDAIRGETEFGPDSRLADREDRVRKELYAEESRRRTREAESSTDNETRIRLYAEARKLGAAAEDGKAREEARERMIRVSRDEAQRLLGLFEDDGIHAGVRSRAEAILETFDTSFGRDRGVSSPEYDASMPSVRRGERLAGPEYGGERLDEADPGVEDLSTRLRDIRRRIALGRSSDVVFEARTIAENSDRLPDSRTRYEAARRTLLEAAKYADDDEAADRRVDDEAWAQLRAYARTEAERALGEATDEENSLEERLDLANWARTLGGVRHSNDPRFATRGRRAWINAYIDASEASLARSRDRGASHEARLAAAVTAHDHATEDKGASQELRVGAVRVVREIYDEKVRALLENPSTGPATEETYSQRLARLREAAQLASGQTHGTVRISGNGGLERDVARALTQAHRTEIERLIAQAKEAAVSPTRARELLAEARQIRGQHLQNDSSLFHAVWGVERHAKFKVDEVPGKIETVVRAVNRMLTGSPSSSYEAADVRRGLEELEELAQTYGGSWDGADPWALDRARDAREAFEHWQGSPSDQRRLIAFLDAARSISHGEGARDWSADAWETRVSERIHRNWGLETSGSGKQLRWKPVEVGPGNDASTDNGRDSAPIHSDSAPFGPVDPGRGIDDDIHRGDSAPF